MQAVDSSAIRIRPYTKEDDDQVAEILFQGFNTASDPLFFHRVKHYSTALTIFTKSILYTSLLELALTAYTSSSNSAADPLPFSFKGLSMDAFHGFSEALMRPESAQSLIFQFLKPSFIIIWVIVTLIVASTTLVDIHRWSVRITEKFIESSFKDDLADIHQYYQTQSSTNGKKNRSQFWVACLDSHPQLVLGCCALDDNWAHTERLKQKYLADEGGRSEDSFEASPKTDGQIRRLSVHPNYRQLGISKMLLATLMDYAKKNGFRRLTFTTTFFQKVAIANYIRAGFTKEKTAKLERFVDLWHGSLNLYATEEDKEEQRSRRGEMLREIGAL
ncbi:acyl-CoA N-acyltransferase [Dissophora ornata]|nr:hypothetical protein BGZ58_009924 [Dissophora ornata]KAI8595687.1 acyl-CoA N-acyltransferase [Dissophora ornata]